MTARTYKSVPCCSCGDDAELPACDFCDGEGVGHHGGDCGACAGSGIEPEDGDFVDESEVLCADCWRADRVTSTRDWAGM